MLACQVSSQQNQKMRISLSGAGHMAPSLWASAIPEPREAASLPHTHRILSTTRRIKFVNVRTHRNTSTPVIRSTNRHGLPRRRLRAAGRREGPRRQLHLRQEARRRQAVAPRRGRRLRLPLRPQAPRRRRGGQVRRQERLLRPRRHRQHHRAVGPLRLRRSLALQPAPGANQLDRSINFFLQPCSYTDEYICRASSSRRSRGRSPRGACCSSSCWWAAGRCWPTSARRRRRTCCRSRRGRSSRRSRGRAARSKLSCSFSSICLY